MKSLADTYKLPVIVSTHPRTRKIIEQNHVKISSLVLFLKPFGFTDYNALQMNAKVVLSDSGTISEESSILNFPALNIREAHERPEAMEEAAVMMVGFHKERVIQGISLLEQTENKHLHRIVSDYSMPDVSEKVARIILSYTDYVRRVVWKE